jgi:hypothetical protein
LEARRGRSRDSSLGEHRSTVFTGHDSYFGEGDFESQSRDGVTRFMVCDDVSTNRIRLHVFHSPPTTLHSCIATATSAPHCREDRTLQGRPASASVRKDSDTQARRRILARRIRNPVEQSGRVAQASEEMRGRLTRLTGNPAPRAGEFL